MVPVKGSIISRDETATTEEVLLTYSEEEKQRNEINAANAELVFSPAFIPFDTALQREQELSDQETKIYGFIAYYMRNASNRFYFTNEQLGAVVNCHPTNVSKSLKVLEEKGLIKTSRKMRAGGGLIRFVEPLPITKLQSGKSPTSAVAPDHLHINKNNINQNKTNVDTNVSTQAKPAKKVYGDPVINEVATYFLERMKLPSEDCSQKQSRQYWSLLLKESKRGSEGVRWLIDTAATDAFWRNNITSSKDLYYKRVKIVARKRGTLPRVAIQEGGGTTWTNETGVLPSESNQNG